MAPGLVYDFHTAIAKSRYEVHGSCLSLCCEHKISY